MVDEELFYLNRLKSNFGFMDIAAGFDVHRQVLHRNCNDSDSMEMALSLKHLSRDRSVRWGQARSKAEKVSPVIGSVTKRANYFDSYISLKDLTFARGASSEDSCKEDELLLLGFDGDGASDSKGDRFNNFCCWNLTFARGASSEDSCKEDELQLLEFDGDGAGDSKGDDSTSSVVGVLSTIGIGASSEDSCKEDELLLLEFDGDGAGDSKGNDSIPSVVGVLSSIGISACLERHRSPNWAVASALSSLSDSSPFARPTQSISPTARVSNRSSRVMRASQEARWGFGDVVEDGEVPEGGGDNASDDGVGSGAGAEEVVEDIRRVSSVSLSVAVSAMGYTKDQLLARLKELQIDFLCYDHPPVLAVEAQAKEVGHLGGALSKNLLLKDKKQRFYVVSALADTNVDLKVLSQRLGLGKGGLRMAPEEALQELLQVPLGCVTPFALINDSARSILQTVELTRYA
ncbi:hypothetical protein ZIOFF_034453 [Zingiber officinale]|uniref:YbaK/aminoacyl-tRNA synthetase-associated domain-containing protein n=1 Tax=Zingiber officinale TaxID=94328 RepID=A0A8J5LDJ0_ZINOF|nr:hypothetical protein ZIOFF_034453 [Zingiber officinale]